MGASAAEMSPGAGKNEEGLRAMADGDLKGLKVR